MVDTKIFYGVRSKTDARFRTKVVKSREFHDFRIPVVQLSDNHALFFISFDLHLAYFITIIKLDTPRNVLAVGYNK